MIKVFVCAQGRMLLLVWMYCSGAVSLPAVAAVGRGSLFVVRIENNFTSELPVFT